MYNNIMCVSFFHIYIYIYVIYLYFFAQCVLREEHALLMLDTLPQRSFKIFNFVLLVKFQIHPSLFFTKLVSLATKKIYNFFSTFLKRGCLLLIVNELMCLTFEVKQNFRNRQPYLKQLMALLRSISYIEKKKKKNSFSQLFH